MSSAPLGTVLTAPRLLTAAGAALAVAAPGVALSAIPGRGVNAAYAGKSAQGLTIMLSAPRSFGRTFSYQATMNCSDGTTFTDATFTDVVTVRSGRFHVRVKSDKDAVVTDVAGRLSGRRASGTIQILERYSVTPDAQGNLPLDTNGTVVCQSGAVRWSAKAK